MKISNYLREECCILDLKARDKEGAVKEIVGQLSLAGRVVDVDKFVNDVLEREKLGSTGIGHTIAIPHARTAAVKGFVIGFGKSGDGIDFKSIDGAGVNLIFLMGTAPKELNLYLRLLAELSKLLMNVSFREKLMNVGTAEEVIETIKNFEAHH